MKAPLPLADTVTHAIGSTVFHKTEPSRPGIVVGIYFYPGGHYYRVQWDQMRAADHYAVELTDEKGID